MFYRKIFGGLVLIVVILVVSVSSTNGALSQNDSSSYQGEITLCLQQQYYSEEYSGEYNPEASVRDGLARSAQYWEFASTNNDIRQFYIIENHQGTLVCRELLLDYGRQVVYHQVGDNTPDFFQIAKFNSPELCVNVLLDNTTFSFTPDQRGYTTIDIQPIESNFEIEIEYPDELLLYPAYVGDFPQPLRYRAELTPFKGGRGFSFEMPLRALEDNVGLTGIQISEGQFDQAAQETVFNYYRTAMGPGWYTNDCMLDRGGNRNPNYDGDDLWFALCKDSHKIEFHFYLQQVTSRDWALQGVISTPIPAIPSDSPEVFIGAAGAVSDVETVFHSASLRQGWITSDYKPQSFLDDSVHSYVMTRNNEILIADFDRMAANGQSPILYSQTRIRQEACPPSNGDWPDWVLSRWQFYP